jgi:hypothetical protein
VSLGACLLPLLRPDVVPEVEVPGGLDAREDARHGLILVRCAGCDLVACTLPWRAMTATLLTRDRALDHGWVVSCACPWARRSCRVTT